MNSTNLTLEVFSEQPKKQKKVRISKIIEVRNLSPEIKEWNQENNFSRKERNETLQNILFDREFIQYLETRRNRNNRNNHGNTNKEYRSRIISLWQKRKQMLVEICNRNTQPLPKTITLFFFDTIASTSFPSYFSEKYYYKSFLYPI